MPEPIPQLETPRLLLRGFRASDLDAYAAMCADAEVMRHIGGGGPVGRDVAWGQIAFFLGHWPLRGYGMWAIEHRASGALIGRAGFIHPEGWPGLERTVDWLLARTELPRDPSVTTPNVLRQADCPGSADPAGRNWSLVNRQANQ